MLLSELVARNSTGSGDTSVTQSPIDMSFNSSFNLSFKEGENPLTAERLHRLRKMSLSTLPYSASEFIGVNVMYCVFIVVLCLCTRKVR